LKFKNKFFSNFDQFCLFLEMNQKNATFKKTIIMSLLLNRNKFGDVANTGKTLSKEEANLLLKEWVLNDKLRLHMLQVSHLMKCWAAKKEGLGEEGQWRWEMAGLLHDADWDQWPGEHCKKIIEELERRSVDPEIIHAIASHGPNHFGVEPETRMDKMLYAFDELSGLIHAYSLMRPNGYEGMELKGVKKRLKEKSFAANVSREEIADACSRAGVELETLIPFIIEHQADVEKSQQ
jgi:predicted hydrolase (HD superfamily)